MSDTTVDAEASAHDVGSENSAPRLKRLKINKFRNVRPTELVFDDDWNVLLGKNSTGKTTLLELIAATIRGDVGAFEGVDLDVEADLMLGPAQVKWSLKSVESPSMEHVAASFPGAIVRSARRRFHAEFSRQSLPGVTVSGDEHGIDGLHGSRAISIAGDDALFALMLMTKGSQILLSNKPTHAVNAAFMSGDVQRFDEVLTLFNRIGPGGDLVISSSFNEQSLASPELVNAFRSVYQTAAERIIVKHHQLPFLQRFVDLCDFSSASLHLELLRRNASQEEPQAWFGRPSFLFRRRNGEELREQHLSFGQKRLLSFLFYLTISNPVIADELVDGLHFDWISACVEATRGRQKFFASQNPLLVDHMGFNTRAAVKSRFIRCSVEGDEMIWENFTDAEADDFFVAYRTGIQGVSEVLRQKGLW